MEPNLPAFMSPAGKRKKINERSARQEKKHAKRIGGKVQPGSGSSKRAPEDVKGPLEDGEGVLVQMKEYETGRYTITQDECAKLIRNARQSGREPQLIIDFPRRKIRLTIDIGEIPK